MTFHVGQKVVCVNDEWCDPEWSVDDWNYFFPHRPKRGRLYTVRAIETFNDGDDGLYLKEIVNPFHFWGNGYLEGCFGESRFRPITERKTDISIFQKMLTSKEVEAAE